MESTSCDLSLVSSSSSTTSTSRSANMPRSFPLFSKNQYRPPLRSRSLVRCSLLEQEEKANQGSSTAVAPDKQKEVENASHHAGGEDGAKASHHVGGGDQGGQEKGNEKGSKEEQQVDWKSDEEFKKFMGNPSIEAAIELEKKSADRKLREPDANPLAGLLRGLARDQLAREKQRLEQAEQNFNFKALDLNKLKSCFSMSRLHQIRRKKVKAATAGRPWQTCWHEAQL